MKPTILLSALTCISSLAFSASAIDPINARAASDAVQARAWVDEHFPRNALQSRVTWKRCDKPNSDGTCNPDPTCDSCKKCLTACNTATGFGGAAIGGCTTACDTNIICSNPCGVSSSFFSIPRVSDIDFESSNLRESTINDFCCRGITLLKNHCLLSVIRKFLPAVILNLEESR